MIFSTGLFSEATANAHVHAAMADEESFGHRIWAIHSGNNLIGWLSAGARIFQSHEAIALSTHLHAIYVIPEFRNRGAAWACSGVAATQLSELVSAELRCSLNDVTGEWFKSCYIEMQASCLSPGGRQCTDRFNRVFFREFNSMSKDLPILIEDPTDISADFY